MTGTEPLPYDIVVASDNNDYLAWQCLLFHHSCVTHLGRTPIIVVHGDDKPLVPAYRLLQAKGGNIQRLPTMRFAGGIEYSPRNMWASFKGVETAAEHIVLCDPDMIFLAPVDFGEITAKLKGEAVSVDHMGYMVTGEHNRSILESVCKKAWISSKVLQGTRASGYTPLVVPTKLRRRLGREWARLTEDYLVTSFAHHGSMNSEVWISSMWGFVLAAYRIGAPMYVTNLCATNAAASAAVNASRLRDYPMVHYCYGDDIFDKRRFMKEEDSLKNVWKAQAPAGTVNGAVTAAIRETAAFYELT